MKKKIFILFYLILTISLTSCFENSRDNYLPEFESGYFKYVLKKNNDKGKSAYLVGFTELGLQQRFIILPSTIDNYEIRGIGYLRSQLFFEAYYVYTFRSDKLERLYIVNDSEIEIRLASYRGILPNCYIVKPNEYTDIEVEFFRGRIDSFDRFQKSGGLVEYRTTKPYIIGNVTFLYNYDNAPFNNYYWTDSYDNRVVEFVPPDPLREGYIFDGWYKDSLLTERWNFDSDTTGDEIILEYHEEYSEYTGIYLYAKWITNGGAM